MGDILGRYTELLKRIGLSLSSAQGWHPEVLRWWRLRKFGQELWRQSCGIRETLGRGSGLRKRLGWRLSQAKGGRRRLRNLRQELRRRG
mmetsp:Transcript_90409/g.281482  ORF Transcript_90409/g.281482 Transcript_90409/m.281482 type:complete len:89 (+) Transcript_90409:90-356(+)